MATLGIGEVARRSGVSVDAVRYYEREGLLTPLERRASGYRRYGEGELARLRFIRRAQNLGFSLKETRELLALSSRRSVATVKRLAQQKLADIESRLADLQRIKRGLDELVRACPGHGQPEQCPILRALGGEDHGR
jgi:MerR family copper efflux transcriptional regulator